MRISQHLMEESISALIRQTNHTLFNNNVDSDSIERMKQEHIEIQQVFDKTSISVSHKHMGLFAENMSKLFTDVSEKEQAAHEVHEHLEQT